MLPDVSIKNIEEGNFRLYDKVVFNQEFNNATSIRGETMETAESSDHIIEGCIHDVLSVVYYSRNINFNQFEVGEEFPVKVFVDKKVYPLSMKYQGRVANKKIKGNGRFNTCLLYTSPSPRD